jgi:hypothetical protein
MCMDPQQQTHCPDGKYFHQKREENISELNG